jgi:RecJ-like exonuclease
MFFSRFRLCEELQNMERLRRIVVEWDAGIGRQELIAEMAYEFLIQRCEELGMTVKVELNEQVVPTMQDLSRTAIAHWRDTKNGYVIS